MFYLKIGSLNICEKWIYEELWDLLSSQVLDRVILLNHGRKLAAVYSVKLLFSTTDAMYAAQKILECEYEASLLRKLSFEV